MYLNLGLKKLNYVLIYIFYILVIIMTYVKELTCHWLANLKLSRIIILVTLTLVLVPLFTHYYLSNVSIHIIFICKYYNIYNLFSLRECRLSKNMKK